MARSLNHVLFGIGSIYLYGIRCFLIMLNEIVARVKSHSYCAPLGSGVIYQSLSSLLRREFRLRCLRTSDNAQVTDCLWWLSRVLWLQHRCQKFFPRLAWLVLLSPDNTPPLALNCFLPVLIRYLDRVVYLMTIHLNCNLISFNSWSTTNTFIHASSSVLQHLGRPSDPESTCFSKGASQINGIQKGGPDSQTCRPCCLLKMEEETPVSPGWRSWRNILLARVSPEDLADYIHEGKILNRWEAKISWGHALPRVWYGKICGRSQGRRAKEKWDGANCAF